MMLENVREKDAGMSLVELIVYVVVAAILLAVVAGVLISGFRATTSTGDRDIATGALQAISTSLSSDIRDASDVQLDESATSWVVRARIADGRAGWQCRAWAIVDLEKWEAGVRTSESDGKYELRILTYDDEEAMSVPPAPTPSWGVLARDVQRIAVTSTASPVPSPSPTPTYRPYFTEDSGTLTWNLAVAAATNEKVSAEQRAALSGAAVARAYSSEGTATECW